MRVQQTATVYMDVSLDRGASYGDTLVWKPGNHPGNGEAGVIVQENLYKEKFHRELIEMMTRPTPGAQK